MTTETPQNMTITKPIPAIHIDGPDYAVNWTSRVRIVRRADGPSRHFFVAEDSTGKRLVAHRSKLRGPDGKPLAALCAVVFLAFTLTCQGAGFPNPGVLARSTKPVAGGGGGNPPASPLINQNFEGTGYDNSESWTESGFGTQDEDYTGTVLLGSQSLRITCPDSTSGRTEKGFTSGSERWGFCYFRLVANMSAGSYFVFFDDVGNSRPLKIGIGTGSTLRVTCGSATAETVATISTGTTYYLWWHYLKGSGANATGELWVSTTTTKPADGSNGHAKTTAGTATTDVLTLGLGSELSSGNDTEILFDHTYVDDAVILSNP